MDITIIFVGVVGLIVGFLIGRFLLLKIFKQFELDAKKQSDLILEEAKVKSEAIRDRKIFEAKEKFLKLKSELSSEKAKFKTHVSTQEAKIKQIEQKQKQKEGSLAKDREDLKKEMDQLISRKEKIEAQEKVLVQKLEDTEKKRLEQVSQLEKISNLKADEAREQLIEALKDEARANSSNLVKQIVEEAKVGATKEAKKIVLSTIQRTAAEHAIENCVSVFHLESDELKGKIIGREGRNIRAIEAATGVEIIVDDTPEAIIISGFDPVRREIARISLHRLVQDGRIHPARIEEVVSKTTKHIEEEILELGERTVVDLGIHGIHPELKKIIGRMRYRSSYGQNLLQHSREVANLAAIMAAEMGLPAKAAKRAGLLHDIGKVPTEESDLPHAILGMKWAEKYGESPEICNAIGAHHDEIEMTGMISPIIQACDAISGSRPGARREMMESYIKRLQDLEALALGFKGVNKCYAMQAGRELRIMVDAERVSDEAAGQLSFEISSKIEKDLQYPGQIKVTVIREMRSVNYAR